MSLPAVPTEYLVISRGQWDPQRSSDEIQTAIDQFYAWLDQLVSEGKMKRGQRLGVGGKTVTRDFGIIDGPFGETKEVIGGYWTIVAPNVEEAALIAQGNPCLRCGLFYEIRPIEKQCASPFDVTNETPTNR